MKIILIFLACCLAVTLAQSNDELNKLRETAAKECLEEMKLTEQETMKDQSKQECVYACMHKKLGYFKDDGTLNLKAMIGSPGDTEFEKEFEKLANRLYKLCVETAKGDSCKLSYCLENTKEF